jgi:putative spermidine/putrescine transport system ATP-binding protein
MGFRNLLELEVAHSERLEPRVALRGRGIAISGVLKQPLQGRRVIAAIRPDEMSLVAAPAANTIAGTVESVEYYGRDSLITVVAAGGIRLHVRVSVRVEPGFTVMVAVPPERVLVFPAPGNGHD